MNLKKLIALLISYNSFIVHCASVTKGIGEDYTYLTTLENAIKTKPPLPCSTISVGDTLDILGPTTNYMGTIGIILVPNSDNSISFASRGDGGQTPEDRNREAKLKVSTTLQAVEDVIVNREYNGYNELSVYDYNIIGIFFDRMPVQFAPIKCGDKHIFYDLDVFTTYGTMKDIDFFYLEKGELYNTDFDDKTSKFKISEKIEIELLYKIA